jgi:hypothetical protein
MIYEHDLSQLPVLKRGPGRKAPQALAAELEPDVAAARADHLDF